MNKPKFKSDFFELPLEESLDVSEKKVEEIIEKAKQTDDVYLIPISLIDAPAFHDRTTYDKEFIKELADNIKEAGQIQPIAAKVKDNGRYERIVGFHRIEALKLNGERYVKAVLFEGRNAGTVKLMMLSENIKRRNLNAYDEVRGILEYLSEELGKTSQGITNMIHQMANKYSGHSKSKPTEQELSTIAIIEKLLLKVSKYKVSTFKSKLSILNMHERIIAAIKERTLDFTLAEQLHKLRRYETDMLRLLDEVLAEKITGKRELKEAVDLIIKSKSGERNAIDAISKNDGIEAHKRKGVFYFNIRESKLTEIQKAKLNEFLEALKTSD